MFGSRSAWCLGAALGSAWVVGLAAPAQANYQAPQVAIRVEGDDAFNLNLALVNRLANRPRLRHLPTPLANAEANRGQWLAQAQKEAQSALASGQAYALVVQLSRGPMRMGHPQEETREGTGGRKEVWLVGTIEQDLSLRAEFLDLKRNQGAVPPFVVAETMRRRFEVEITGLNGFLRAAKGVALGQRLGTELRRSPNEVFAAVLEGASNSLATACVAQVAGLPIFDLFAHVEALDASRDRVRVPIGQSVGIQRGDAFAWENPSGQRVGLFRARELGANHSELQPILWNGLPPVGTKLVELKQGNSWLSPLVGGAFLGAPMVGGGLRLAMESARLYRQADGFLIVEGSAYRGLNGTGLWGGAGVGGRSFVRNTTLGWRILGGSMASSLLTKDQAIPALCLGLSVDRLLSPSLAVGAEISPLVGWPIQNNGSTQVQLPLGAMGQVGLHLIF